MFDCVFYGIVLYFIVNFKKMMQFPHINLQSDTYMQIKDIGFQLTSHNLMHT
jgi:hypothetical protein